MIENQHLATFSSRFSTKKNGTEGCSGDKKLLTKNDTEKPKNLSFSNASKSNTEKKSTYNCKKCKYTTSIKGNWKRHLKSKKHIRIEGKHSCYMCEICKKKL